MSKDFSRDIAKLEQETLPENWEWSDCNKQARMAYHKSSPECYYKEFP